MKEKKNLSAKEIAELLGIPLVTVQRWVHQGKIPCKFKHNDYFFKKSEIESWARAHDFSITPQEKNKPGEKEKESHILSRAIKRGGIFYDLKGDDIYTVLKNGTAKVDFPGDTNRDRILDELLNREEIASTGIGKGAAIPHPRHILDLNLDEPLMPLFFLRQGVDFNSVDGKPVFVLFFMFSTSTDIHLKLLSRLSFCLRDNEFLAMLKQKTTGEELLKKIKEIEKNFNSV
jgi:PTS system nitrogen regulatory IIA component